MAAVAQSRVRAILIAILLCLGALPARAQAAEPVAVTPGPCVPGLLPRGAFSLFCAPSSGWNGDLVVFAHGYVPVTQPLGFYNLTTPSGLVLPDLAQQLGFAFATTSYRQNGLAILEGVDDVENLIRTFWALPGATAGPGPHRTYVLGVSEGGLVATLLAERRPALESGALAACGPIGDFRGQIDSIGDVRVLFDYFFPGVIPGTAIDVPQQVVTSWDSVYLPRIRAAVAAYPDRAVQVVSAAHAVIDPADPRTIVSTITDALSYSVLGAADAAAKLGGNPYSNRSRVYTGSSNDLQLNLAVQRFDASPAALQNLAKYETSGDVSKPLVTLHTSGDDVVPFWHELVYALKASASHSSARVTQFPVIRYAHCNFTSGEILFSFAVLLQQVTGSQPAALTQRPDVQRAAQDLNRNQRTAIRPTLPPRYPHA
jgi:pimeloyl-ACP methyl ester carboxylesterase